MTTRILGWEGYDDALVLEPFSSATGITVVVDNHIGDADACQRVLKNPGTWDIVNINSPFVRNVLHPAGRIEPLRGERFRTANRTVSQPFAALQDWGCSPAGETIGVCQRFGPFNLVINTDAIGVGDAEDLGFALAHHAGRSGRYGILAYEDFNVMHIAIAAGLDPFKPLADSDFAAFSATAAAWYAGASIVTCDHNMLNRALVQRDIDFYLGGGIYTASPVRLDGQSQVRAITPRRGPVNGLGAIAFVEVNALLADGRNADQSKRFLEYLLRPETALRASFAGAAANPVLQMIDPLVFRQFSRLALHAMQWDTIEEELSRCAQYRVVPDYDRLRALLPRR